jgi:uncharacterized protein YneF (UPF0154 family)
MFWQIYLFMGCAIGLWFTIVYWKKYWQEHPMPTVTKQQRMLAAAQMGIVGTVAFLISGLLWPASLVEVAWKTYKKARKNR